MVGPLVVVGFLIGRVDRDDGYLNPLRPLTELPHLFVTLYCSITAPNLNRAHRKILANVGQNEDC